MLETARALSVSQLTESIAQAIERAPGLYDTIVSGEVSNFVHHSSGHMYFTLKDDKAAVKCIMFQTWNQRLPFKPENGHQVYVRGDVVIYRKGGNYQLNVFAMEPAGQGSLALAFAQLKQRLELEGLFAEAGKQSLPAYPWRIGLVTAAQGAALQDFLATSRQLGWPCTIQFVPALMQGAGGAASVVAALEYLNRVCPDVIVITRGGGSLEELWVFNEESVARAVAASRVPVVSAIGHETDYTICDFAADVRAATPTAAARLVVPDCSSIRQNLDACALRLDQATRIRIQTASHRLAQIAQRPAFVRPLQLLLQPRQNLDYLLYRLKNGFVSSLSSLRNSLISAENRIGDLNPLNIMNRGYSVIRGAGGIIKSVNDLKPDQQIDLQLRDGVAVAVVRSVEGAKYDE